MARAHNNKPAVEKLTEQERLYIKLVCREEEPSLPQVAEHMRVVPKTADKHRAKAYKKLGVHSRLELFFKCVRLGLVPCPCKGKGEG